MAEYKPYVVVEEFVLNLDNGKKEVRVFKGDIIEFDGSLNVRYKEHEGIARPMATVIRAGEWVRPIKPENIPLLQQRLAGKSSPVATPEAPISSRNVTGGRLLENSDPALVKIEVARSEDRELADLINGYEKATNSGAVPQTGEETTKRESSEPSPKVIQDDERIVATVKNLSDKAASENSAGVIMDSNSKVDMAVVSEEERVVKQTSPKKEASKTPARKKVTIIRDSDSKIVKKTGPLQKAKVEVTPTEKATVSKEERVVKETSYVNDTHTDVGSSTQVSVENAKSVKLSSDGGDQEAVVVGRASKVSMEETETDGIIMHNSVGASDDEISYDASVSSSGDGIEMGEARVGSGSTPVSDLAGDSDDGMLSDGDSSLDIDISDLLG